VILGAGAVARLSEALRRTGAALAFAGTPGDTAERIFYEPGPPRITGWCFMLRGELGQRVDESFRWWCGDNDFDWTARGRGGSVLVPGLERTHLHHNGYTGEHPDLGEQAARDQETFLAKWGRSTSSRSMSELLAGARGPSQEDRTGHRVVRLSFQIDFRSPDAVIRSIVDAIVIVAG